MIKISKSFISQFLPTNPIIVEAGSHKGRDTKEMANLWPNGTIHAFEPVPYIYDILKSNVKDLNNVFCYNLALSSKTGKSKFFLSSGKSDAASSLFAPKEYLITQPKVNFEEIEVNTITLDGWAKLNKIDRVDFLWLDLQGHEMEVLRASTNILKTVKVIFTEINLIERYAGAPLYHEYSNWLISNGFELVQDDLGRKTWGDALFVRKSN